MFAFALVGRAHEPGLSTLKLHYRDQQLLATLILSPRDIESVVMLDRDSDGLISGDEIGANKEVLDQLARALLAAALDGAPLSVLQTQCLLDENNNFEVQTTFAPHSGSSLTVTSKWVEVLPPGHRQFVTFQEATGPAVTEDLLDAANNVFTVTLSPPERPPLEAKPTRLSFWAFFLLGIEHILTGYDHLLFLLALLLVCESFKSIAKIITCFTLAHSITLALATLNIVHLPAATGRTRHRRIDYLRGIGKYSASRSAERSIPSDVCVRPGAWFRFCERLAGHGNSPGGQRGHAPGLV